MATVVKMPKWGLTMTVGTVTDWLIEEGPSSEGDPLFTVETEKAVNDVEAPADGVLVKIVAAQRERSARSADAVAIHRRARRNAQRRRDLAALMRQSNVEAGGAAATAEPHRPYIAGRRRRDESGRVNASPAARRMAVELNIDLSTIEATGPDGRITSDDVERAAAKPERRSDTA